MLLSLCRLFLDPSVIHKPSSIAITHLSRASASILEKTAPKAGLQSQRILLADIGPDCLIKIAGFVGSLRALGRVSRKWGLFTEAACNRMGRELFKSEVPIVVFMWLPKPRSLPEQLCEYVNLFYEFNTKGGVQLKGEDNGSARSIVYHQITDFAKMEMDDGTWVATKKVISVHITSRALFVLTRFHASLQIRTYNHTTDAFVEDKVVTMDRKEATMTCAWSSASLFVMGGRGAKKLLITEYSLTTGQETRREDISDLCPHNMNSDLFFACFGRALVIGHLWDDVEKDNSSLSLQLTAIWWTTGARVSLQKREIHNKESEEVLACIQFFGAPLAYISLHTTVPKLHLWSLDQLRPFGLDQIEYALK
jgi:hypothetical protein